MPEQGDAALGAMLAFVDGLVRCGVAHASISPGSRSTPLALAVARDGRIRIHVHVDERSSAFFALGAAKATGVPALIITTSGTAVANLFPAVVEATLSRTPLIALTADRPPELRGVGANQTIDQVGIFGTHVISAVDAPVPDPSSVDPAGWRSLARAAVRRAVGPPGGPVHVNLPFREPLVPTHAAPGTTEGPQQEEPEAAGRRSDPSVLERVAGVAQAVAGV